MAKKPSKSHYNRTLTSECIITAGLFRDELERKLPNHPGAQKLIDAINEFTASATEKFHDKIIKKGVSEDGED